MLNDSRRAKSSGGLIRQALTLVLATGVACAPVRSASTPRGSHSRSLHAESLRSQFEAFARPHESVRTQGTLVSTPAEPESAPTPPDVPPFSYDLYCDAQGHLIDKNDVALGLMERPEHLRRVYAGAERGEGRAKQLVRDLESVFRRFGAWVAQETTDPGCWPLPELQKRCLPRLAVINELFGSAPELQRLRAVAAQEYEVQARERGARNELIHATLDFLLAAGMFKGMVNKPTGAMFRPATEGVVNEGANGAGDVLKTTAHGAERIAGSGATRGGVLSAEQIFAVRTSGRVMVQADGATVRIHQNELGRFNVVVEGERGIITTFENLSQKSLDRLAKNYGWKERP